MSLINLIKKTIENKRGYVYHTYNTEYDRKNDVLSLYHYGTLILNLNVKTKEILKYNIISFSDKQAINKVINYLQLPFITFRWKLYRIVYYNNVELYIDISKINEKEIEELYNFLDKLDKEQLKDIQTLSIQTKINLVNAVIDGNIKKTNRILKIAKNTRKLREFKKKIFDELYENGYVYLKNCILMHSGYEYYVWFYNQTEIYRAWSEHIKITKHGLLKLRDKLVFDKDKIKKILPIVKKIKHPLKKQFMKKFLAEII